MFVDSDNREYYCWQCPANTYSVGVGLLVDGDFGEWDYVFDDSSDFSVKTQYSTKCY